MTIRAVLFDFGGTLYAYDTLMTRDVDNVVALARDAGVDAPNEDVIAAQRSAARAVFTDYMRRPYYLHRDMFDDALRGMLDRLGGRCDPAAIEAYRARQWDGHRQDFRLRDGVLDTLGQLRARDIHVGMVSNIDDDQLRHLLDVSKLEPHFDAILSSESAGSCKPDGRIFEQAMASAGCAPDEALFVGDSRSADIVGANAAGLCSVLIWGRTDREPPQDEPRPRHVIRRIPELLDLLA